MARASALPVLCGLIVLQSLVLPGAAQASAGGSAGVAIAWFPTTNCVDTIGDPKYNCQKCNMFNSVCLLCRPGFAFDADGACARCNDLLCADCGVKKGACKTCRSLPASDPNSFFNVYYPTFKNAQGMCMRCNSQNSNIGCLTCNTNGTECTKCNDGYYLFEGICTKCSGGPMCQTCNRFGECTKCMSTGTAPSFGLNDAKQCVRCTSVKCTDCNANNQQCKKCVNGAVGLGERGYGANAAGGCSLCSDPLCGLCSTDSTKCWGCLSDDERKFYPYKDAAGVCRRGAIKGCLTYNKDGSCKECDGFEMWIKDGRTCAKLPKCKDKNCVDCRGNTSGCRTCARTFFWNKRQQACQRCAASRCDVCSATSSSTCLVCARGYGLVRGKCQPCAPQTKANPVLPPWCDVCNGNINKCTRCFPPEEYKPNAAGRCVLRMPFV